MNKEEWIWVSIRIFGIFLLVMAILAIPSAITTIYSAFLFQGFPAQELSSAADESTQMAYQIFKAQSAQSVRAVLEVIIYGSFGFYFIHGGKALHKVICRA